MQMPEATAPEPTADEALATWQTVVQAAWGLTNVRVGAKDIVPRVTGVAEALEALRARIAEVHQRQTLEVIEDEMHRARADLAELQHLVQAMERRIDEVLGAVRDRKGTLYTPPRE